MTGSSPVMVVRPSLSFTRRFVDMALELYVSWYSGQDITYLMVSL